MAFGIIDPDTLRKNVDIYTFKSVRVDRHRQNL